jgi:hypothetical protein
MELSACNSPDLAPFREGEGAVWLTLHACSPPVSVDLGTHLGPAAFLSVLLLQARVSLHVRQIFSYVTERLATSRLRPCVETG